MAEVGVAAGWFIPWRSLNRDLMDSVSRCSREPTRRRGGEPRLLQPTANSLKSDI